MLRYAIPLLLIATAANAQTVTVTPPAGAPATISAETLRTFPQSEATLTMGNPPAPHRFQGPLLWTVLTGTHLVDPEKHASAVRQTLIIQGSDRYAAIIAMGELSPEFEAKPALLALSEDGKALAMPRAILPGDHRGGRSVRDVVSLKVDELPSK
jgi:hypothetical protein